MKKLIVAAALMTSIVVNAKTVNYVQTEQPSLTPAILPEGFRVEYIPNNRVWYNTSGDIIICPSSKNLTDKGCGIEGLQVYAGWISLYDYSRKGYRMGNVQLMRSQYYMSAIIYWIPTK
mgnify:CR=1 FL=1